jgi:hypothetical protein
MRPISLYSLTIWVLIMVGSLFCFPLTATAQGSWTLKGAKSGTALPSDLLKMGYFSNANTSGAPDGVVRLDDPGTSPGNVCAQIYVFDPNQEMTECCACLLTPDGLRTLSVNTDLTSNPLTGVKLTNGVVSIVSGVPPSGNTCNPLNNIVEPAVRAWGTHIQNANFAITETQYVDAQLSANNDNLLFECEAIILDGSGHGVCSCGTGD